MAGGLKKPVNIFKLSSTDEPKEVFNWRLWYAVMAFSLMGAARGVDEGLISGAFSSKDFQKTINYSSYSKIEQTNIKANVTAMVQIGSVGGALFAFFICDRIGRIWATRQLCLLWIIGIAIFMGNNGSLGAVYAGRFIAGLGVGQTPVVAPIYLAEILLAPAPIRGICSCIYTSFVYVGIVLAYFANYGAQVNLGDTSHIRWQLPTSVHIMFAGIILLLSFGQYESPRYYIRSGKDEKALDVLSHIRHLPPDHPYIVREISEIQASHQEELEATLGSGFKGIMKEMFLIKSNQYRMFLAITNQLLSQWSGANSITIYAVNLFQLLGISGNNESLLVTAIFGIVKLVAAIICALFLIDFIGRKRSLLIGVSLQLISMIYIAAFLTAVPKLGVDDKYVMPASMYGPSRGAIAMMYLSGFGWALGWNSMQYILSAELFPLRIRAVATSISMMLHFVNQYGNTRAVPNMLLGPSQGGMSPLGTFWFFSGVTFTGLLWVWFFLPETAGRSLETMNRLFELPWYRIGRYGSEHAAEQDTVVDEKFQHLEAHNAEHVENVRENTTKV